MFNHQLIALEAVKNATPPCEGEVVVTLDGAEGFSGFYTMENAIETIKNNPRIVFKPQGFWKL